MKKIISRYQSGGGGGHGEYILYDNTYAIAQCFFGPGMTKLVLWLSPISHYLSNHYKKK